MDNPASVKIKVDVVMGLQDRPALWNDLWRVGKVVGCDYVASECDFDRICRDHFSPFAAGEVVRFVAEPIKRVMRSAGIAVPCRCAERRLKMNLAK